MTKENKVPNLSQKPKKSRKGIYIALAIILPLLFLGIALGLVFGLNTTKTLTVSTVENGSITVVSEGKTLEEKDGKYIISNNKEITVTITPNEGYAIGSITLNGKTVEITAETGASQILSIGKMNKDQELEIEFAIRTFTVEFKDYNGNVLKTETVNYGSNATPPENPTRNDGYYFARWDGSYTSVTANQTVTAIYSLTYYEITATAGENGTISPTEANVGHGGERTFTITPNQGYHISELTVDGKTVTLTDENKSGMYYTLSNITSDHTINVTFDVATYNITVVQPANGNISPTAVENVSHGTQVTFTITPTKENYKVSSVVINGTIIPVDNNGTEMEYQVKVTSATTFTAIIKFKGENGYFIEEDGKLVLDPEGDIEPNEDNTAGYKETVNPTTGETEKELVVVVPDPGPDFTIDTDTTIIGQRAFDSSNLITLDLRETRIKRIMPYAFNNSKIQQVLFPTTLVTLDANALSGMPNIVQMVLNSHLNSNYSLPSPGNQDKLVLGWFREGSTTVISSMQNSGTYYIGYTGEIVEGGTVPNNARFTTSDGWQYRLENNQFYICGVPALNEETNPTKSLTIPATLSTVEHGNVDIYGLNNNYSTLTNLESYSNVLISNGIQEIGNYAFRDCTNLTSVTIPNSVISIGSYAFDGCTGLTSVTIPNSVTSIGSYAFRGCTGLTSVTIGSGVTSIGREAFRGCTGLKSFTVEENNTNYKHSADKRTITSKDGKTLILYANASGSSYTIPNSVISIGRSAFSHCTGLTEITIPNSVTSIGDYAFSDCTGLTSVTIPNSVTNIGEVAFSNCTGLISVTICNGVTRIQRYAFAYCTNLTSVIIPNSVTSIDWYAFSGCTGLTEITIEGNIGTLNSAFNNCSNLKTLNIGSSVTSLPSGLFASGNLTYIETINVEAGNKSFVVLESEQQGKFALYKIGELTTPIIDGLIGSKSDVAERTGDNGFGLYLNDGTGYFIFVKTLDQVVPVE